MEVGYAKGIEAARRLEDNNIIVNYQALPDDEGFTASSGLRLGVSEMTRFGMKEGDMQRVAVLMAEALLKNAPVKDKAAAPAPRVFGAAILLQGRRTGQAPGGAVGEFLGRERGGPFSKGSPASLRKLLGRYRAGFDTAGPARRFPNHFRNSRAARPDRGPGRPFWPSA